MHQNKTSSLMNMILIQYSDYADAGNTAVLKLIVGDRVYVKAHDNYDNAIYGQPGEIYTTFTGELVFPDSTGKVNTLVIPSLPSKIEVPRDVRNSKGP